MWDAAWHHDSSVWISTDVNDLVKESSSLVSLATYQVSLLPKSGKLGKNLMVPSSGRSDGTFLYSVHLVQSPCRAFVKERDSQEESARKRVCPIPFDWTNSLSSAFKRTSQLNRSSLRLPVGVGGDISHMRPSRG